MNRSDLIEAVANKTEWEKDEVGELVKVILDTIGLSLACGEEVNIRRFGKFEPRHRRAVTRRNPKSGAMYDVPAKRTVGFIPSPNLKDRMNKE